MVTTQTLTAQRPKVLISAYACKPGMGSEPGVGWNVVQQMLSSYDVWVLTRSDNRAALEAVVQPKSDPRLHIVYCDLPGSKWWNHKQKAVQIHYYLWQVAAYFVAKKLHQAIDFHVVHHVTYVKYWSPSFLCLLPIPLIWGPVGGGESAPAAFVSDFSLRGKLYESFRSVARCLGEQDPFAQLTARRSFIARATTQDTAKRLTAMGAKRVEVSPAIGLSMSEITHLSQHATPPDQSRCFVSIGRLLHWKGFHLSLQAFAQANLPDAELWIVGNGPERQRLETLASELGITERVRFFGELSRAETLQTLGRCVALVHPSLHESGGLVCMEAMAMKRPVICLDLGGPALQVTAETGRKIPVHTPEQTVQDLTAAMVELFHHPTLRTQLGQAGQQRVQQTFSWEAKAQSIARDYEEAIAHFRQFESKNRSQIFQQPSRSPQQGEM